jgi:uncharacterized protein YjbI with pentapeptide repeats
MGDLTPLSFAADWLPKLVGELARVREKRAKEVAAIGNLFGDPFLLASHYIEPHCQQINPANYDDQDIASVVRSPVFETVRAFFERCSKDIHRDGRRQMFVLADAGMGKTSLLVMLKLMHLHEFWPGGYLCELIKLGPDAVPAIQKLENHARTVLLLDSLDEDSLAWGRANDRILEILQATTQFLAVVITCRTQFFPIDPDSPEKLGVVAIGAYKCPSVYLSSFSNEQVRAYLRKRFPRAIWRQLLGLEDPRQAKAYRVVEQMDTLAMRPMLLAYIDDVMAGDVDKRVLTTYEAFSILVDQWLAREERLSGGKLKAVDLATACLHVARHLDIAGTRVLPLNKLAELAEVDRTVRAIESVHLTGRALLNRTSTGEYRFAHYSLQEFLLAKYLVTRGEVSVDMVGSSDWRPQDGLRHVSVQGSSLLGRFLIEGARQKTPPERTFIVLRTSFRNAAFAGLDLSGMAFVDCEFKDADLRGAQFVRSRLWGCDLSGAHLDHAVLIEASTVGTSFQKAGLPGANLRKLRTTELSAWQGTLATSFERADLNGAHFAGADLANAILQSARLADGIASQTTKWPAGFDYKGAGVSVEAVDSSAPAYQPVGEPRLSVRWDPKRM